MPIEAESKKSTNETIGPNRRSAEKSSAFLSSCYLKQVADLALRTRI
jgi:hypothetical protein